jgi:transmembrane sensor
MFRNRQSIATAPEASPPMREVSTGAGQRAEVKLGDGSTVVLGVKSRLRFPAVLGHGSRELYLEGEAHFAVTHDSTRPFVVHAAGTKTVDLGTAFVLRAYPAEQRVQVVVTEGRVALGVDRPDASPPQEITAGQMGRLALEASAPTIRAVDTAAYTAWLHGRIVFNNTPLAEVAAELSRWHEVEIELGDPSLAREELTASFIAESLQETLRTLSTALQLRVERRGTRVVLYRRAR